MYIDQLLNILIQIKPDSRFAALSAIADPKRKLIVGRWVDENGCACLFAAACMAAAGKDYTDKEMSFEIVSTALGLTKKQVVKGVNIWDGNLTKNDRRKLQQRVAECVRLTYPVPKPEHAKTPVHPGVLQNFSARISACLCTISATLSYIPLLR